MLPTGGCVPTPSCHHRSTRPPRTKEKHPPQASEDGSGERDQRPAVFEETRWMNEDGDRPYDNEADERRHVHKEPDERN